MIVVEFDDGAGSPTLYDDNYDWSSTIFDGNGSLAGYYSEMSSGAFTFSPARESSAAGKAGNHNAADRTDDGVVHVTLPEAHQAWGTVNIDTSMARDFGKVMLRAIDASRSFVDYESYDANEDGVLDPDELTICLCLAGYDASALVDFSRSDIPLVWPHTGYLATATASADEAVTPSSYIALAERIWYDDGPIENAAQEPLGVLYHELGHSLGLPDLYPLNENPENATWGAYAVDALSLMDAGGWAQTSGGDNDPMALDAWSRYVLGWEMPQVATHSGDYVVRSQLSTGGYQSLLIPTSDPNEYFIVENRQPEGADEALSNEYATGNPNGGLVIWHIDKTTFHQYSMANTINNTTHHPAVMENYFEMLPDGSGYAVAWDQTLPNADEPFFDSASCARNYGDAQAEVTLPLYNDDPNNEGPAGRLDSGITLQFPAESSREMIVHVEFAQTEAAQSSRDYPPETSGASGENAGDITIADIACAALLRETGADVALVDGASIQADIPQGALTWSDIYAVLPSDSNIATYSVSGNMLLGILEEAVSDTVTDNGNGVVFGGVTCTIDTSAPEGSRISGVSIGSTEIDPDEVYTIAVTERAYELCPTLSYGVRELEMLWGSPADALRSFVLIPNWEETTEHIVGEKTHLEASEPTQPEAPAAAIVIVAVAVFVLGTLALVLLLRKRQT